MTAKNHLRIVPHLDTPNSLVFDIIERDLGEESILKLGRFTDKCVQFDKITFKSKVVSRGHAEIWVEDNRFYIKDTKSSSGTFVNRIRLSSPNIESSAHILKHGDIVQLGVDYQGGIEEIYRCVKMRIEINKPSIKQSLSHFGLNNFKSLKNLTTTVDENDLNECCICLYALAPFQALFVAPCSHTFHFKCSYPLLQNFPGFTCPLCRSYANLNDNVAIEMDEVAKMLKTEKDDPMDISGSPNLFQLEKLDNLTCQL